VSHVVEIQTEVKDPVAIRAACRRLHLDQPEQGTFKLCQTATARQSNRQRV